MIYERWFTVKDANGLDYLYYSDIRKTPFLNAVKHQNKAYKSMLEKRMYRLSTNIKSRNSSWTRANYAFCRC